MASFERNVEESFKRVKKDMESIRDEMALLAGKISKLEAVSQRAPKKKKAVKVKARKSSKKKAAKKN